MSLSKNGIAAGLLWKLMERFGVQGVQFVLQIILARLLSPDHYGTLSLMIIFTTLADVFIQKGFSTALIQNKDVSEEDYSSVFWVTLSVAGILYGILFLSAPLIASFYDMPELLAPFRILCLMLFPGALNSVQLAKVSRDMDFKKVFYSNIGGMLVSGMAGVTIALLGGGLWALVIQTMLNTATACVVMFFTIKWRPRPVCNWKRVGILFSYGWKLLISSLLDTLYQDLRSLVVGKKYDSDTLGYYNRGKQFPQFIINAVNGAVQSVLLPAMSAEQEDRAKVKAMMRNSIMLSSYIIFPMMIGLAGVATPLVRLILTDKWLPCVPYMQIYCFTLAFYPVHTSNLQAINAIGRSDIYLKLEVIKKIIGIGSLVISLVFFDSPIAIAMTGAITSIISSFINAWPSRVLIGYSISEQMIDILPSVFSSCVMLAGILWIPLLQLGTVITLVLQVLVGIMLYLLISYIARLKPFMAMIALLKGRKK